jgi:hypothetical protein
VRGKRERGWPQDSRRRVSVSSRDSPHSTCMLLLSPLAPTAERELRQPTRGNTLYLTRPDKDRGHLGWFGHAFAALRPAGRHPVPSLSSRWSRCSDLTDKCRKQHSGGCCDRQLTLSGSSASLALHPAVKVVLQSCRRGGRTRLRTRSGIRTNTLAHPDGNVVLHSYL